MRENQVSPQEVRSANSFGLSGGSAMLGGGFHDRTGWQVMADWQLLPEGPESSESVLLLELRANG